MKRISLDEQVVDKMVKKGQFSYKLVENLAKNYKKITGIDPKDYLDRAKEWVGDGAIKAALANGKLKEYMDAYLPVGYEKKKKTGFGPWSDKDEFLSDLSEALSDIYAELE